MMTLTIRKNNTTLLHFLFIMWLASELLFEYSTISQLSLLLFIGCSLLLTTGKYWSYSLTAYLLFALWSVANIIFGHAVDVSIASKMTRTLFLNLLFLYALVCYCRYVHNIKSVLTIYKWVVVAFCVLCLLGGISAVLSGSRLSILGINSNVIASMAAYAGILAFNDILVGRSRSERQVNTYVCVLLLLTILLTGSRKGLLIPIIGIYILICFRKPRKFVLYSITAMIVVAVILFLVLNVEFLYNVIGYRVEPVLQYLAQEEFTEASLDSRSDYILLGWLSSQDSLIFGHGLDCFRTLRYAYGTYSHNNYIEILYSLGWVGISIYYSSFALSIIGLPKTWCSDKENTALVAGILIPFLVCDYMNVSYFSRYILMIPIVMMLYIRKRGDYSENQEIY